MKRSFSAHEEIVIAYSNEFLKAHKDARIISVLKHSPGHGSALKDSHKQFTDVSETWEYRELKPYYDAIKSEKIDRKELENSYKRIVRLKNGIN